MEIKPCLICGKQPNLEPIGQSVTIGCVKLTDDDIHFFSIVGKTRDKAIVMWNKLMTDDVVK